MQTRVTLILKKICFYVVELFLGKKLHGLIFSHCLLQYKNLSVGVKYSAVIFSHIWFYIFILSNSISNKSWSCC